MSTCAKFAVLSTGGAWRAHEACPHGGEGGAGAHQFQQHHLESFVGTWRAAASRRKGGGGNSGTPRAGQKKAHGNQDNA
eukprot:scaffold36955_cov69-Phaeocystis_antarctica.AAC.2